MFKWYTFHQLELDDLYDLLALRQEVFTVEQKCTENDLDYRDQVAVHLLIRESNKLIGYLRLFPVGTLYPDAIGFGRVLIPLSHRGKGLGRQMMDEILLYLKNNKIEAPIIISAQLYLKKFYEEYGFKGIGEPYDEAGIPHLKMRKN